MDLILEDQVRPFDRVGQTSYKILITLPAIRCFLATPAPAQAVAASTGSRNPRSGGLRLTLQTSSIRISSKNPPTGSVGWQSWISSTHTISLGVISSAANSWLPNKALGKSAIR